jgi:hypothetical protein
MLEPIDTIASGEPQLSTTQKDTLCVNHHTFLVFTITALVSSLTFRLHNARAIDEQQGVNHTNSIKAHKETQRACHHSV